MIIFVRKSKIAIFGSHSRPHFFEEEIRIKSSQIRTENINIIDVRRHRFWEERTA